VRARPACCYDAPADLLQSITPFLLSGSILTRSKGSRREPYNAANRAETDRRRHGKIANLKGQREPQDARDHSSDQPSCYADQRKEESIHVVIPSSHSLHPPAREPVRLKQCPFLRPAVHDAPAIDQGGRE
jgi:hypothetical protein